MKGDAQTPMAVSIKDQEAFICDTYNIYRESPDSPFKLYNIVEDSGESTHLADSEPEKLAEMKTLWNTWKFSRKSSAEGMDY